MLHSSPNNNKRAAVEPQGQRDRRSTRCASISQSKRGNGACTDSMGPVIDSRRPLTSGRSKGSSTGCAGLFGADPPITAGKAASTPVPVMGRLTLERGVVSTGDGAGGRGEVLGVTEDLARVVAGDADRAGVPWVGALGGAEVEDVGERLG